MVDYPAPGTDPWHAPLKAYIDDKGKAAGTSYAGGVNLPASTVEVALDRLDDRTYGAALAGAVDMDTVTAAGAYRHGYNAGNLNVPLPDGGFLDVRVGSGSPAIIYQTWRQVGGDSGTTYERKRNASGTWSAWMRTDVRAHTTLTSGAHAATAISYAGGPKLPASTVEAAIDALDQRGVAASIAPSTNADTLLAHGSHFAFTTSLATVALNYPVDGFQGHIRVSGTPDSLELLQEAYHVNGQTWYRIRNGSTWGPWRGGSTAGYWLGAVDYNTVINAGVYAFSGSAPNAPAAVAALVTVTTEGNNVIQRADTNSSHRSFVRVSQDSGATWQAWREVSYKDDRVPLRSPADFNTYLEPEIVFINTGSVANRPHAGYGYLEVTRMGSGGNQIKQEFTVASAVEPRKFFRTTTDSGATWSPWREQLTIGTAVAGGVITGTGNPNGTVSAPIGARFVNTEAGGYNGARVWRKDSGTGNTGWVVTEGDTGWRNIPDLVSENWELHHSAGLLRMRRVNGRVLLYGRLNRKTASGSRVHSSVIVASIPAGFAHNYYATLGTATSSQAGVGGVGSRFSTGQLEVFHWSAGGAWAVGDEAVFTAAWETHSAWPTTLPGTAV